MLSRTADHLYWMGRYVERAENLARLLEVNVAAALLPRPVEEGQQSWAAVLAAVGALEPYNVRYGVLVPQRVVELLAFDPDSRESLVGCIVQARENARAVRGTLTSEVWETVNETWLEMRQRLRAGVPPDALEDFLDWVRQRSHIVSGAVIGTMLRNEGYHFSRIGTFLERADHTARLLDVQLRILAPEGVTHDGRVDYYRYSALLRSASAFEIYRQAYRDRITAERVAELLILREDMPRSLRRCLDEVNRHLALVGRADTGETLRRAGAMRAELQYGRIDQLLAGGADRFLAGFLARLRELSVRVSNDFLLPQVS